MASTVFDPEKTAGYYDDTNVSEFYEQCWGGEDIHIGLYATGQETVAEASAAMTAHLLDKAGIAPGMAVLDIACGFGGTLRTLARLGCQASGIDISQNCVDHARRSNVEAGLGDRIEVSVGDFHRIDSAPGNWDAVVCQEAIIHSPDRQTVFDEAHRVLRPGGIFAVSDILNGPDADRSRVEAAYARLGARVGATIDDYRSMAREAGFDIVDVEERPRDIRTHYDKLADQLAAPVDGMSADATASIAKSIAHWQAALAHGDITWGCIVARKRQRD